MSKSITLIIPSLFDNLPEPVPRLPALETLLARADYRDDLPVGYERTLMHLFDLPQSTDRDVPEGALGRYAQTGEKPEGIWLCAAPVHLFADQSRVYLNTIEDASLSEAEAAQLIAELNQLYKQDGWEFVQHTSTQWYLRIPEEPAIRTTPLREVDGKAIHDKLPQGDEGLQWHRVLNEMQMLLHASPVNQARQEKGKLQVNGVWLWGVGKLPPVDMPAKWDAVISDTAVVEGLAYQSGVSFQPLPNNAVKCLDNMVDGSQLVIHVPHDQTLRKYSLEQFEQYWFSPLLCALKQREIVSLSLQFTTGQEWRLTCRSLHRFWRRRKVIHQ